VANETLPVTGGDPGWPAAMGAPLHPEHHGAAGTRVVLVQAFNRSGIRVAAAMDHVVEAPGALELEVESF